jgi:hypothetical protein
MPRSGAMRLSHGVQQVCLPLDGEARPEAGAQLMK